MSNSTEGCAGLFFHIGRHPIGFFSAGLHPSITAERKKPEAYNLEIQIQFREGKSIKEIVKNLPEDITNQAQIAQLLAGFSINKKDYKSAEKWIKVFYKQIDKEDYITLSSYADFMLKIITQDPDMYKTKEKASHQYQNEFKKVISIYKKIFLDSEYSEIKEVNANLYVNYAIALEIKGELDKAISILTEGESLFPKDYSLKNQLIKFLIDKQSYSINLFHKENPEPFSFKKIFKLSPKGSFNKIEKIINKIPDTKRTLFMWNVLVKIKIFNENKKEEGIRILKNLSSMKNFSFDDQIIIKETLIEIFMEIDQVEEAEQEWAQLEKLDPKNPIIPVTGSKISALKGDTETQKKYLEKALKLAPNNLHNKWFIYSLANELYMLKMYAECEPLFENFIKNNLHNPDIFTLLHIYFENGQNQKAIKLAEDLHQQFPQNMHPVNILFLIYQDIGNKEKAIQYYENFMIKNPENNTIKIELSLAYIKNEQLDKAKDLLNPPFNLSQLSINEISRLAFAYSHTGQLEKALDILYQSIQKYPSNKGLQQTYLSLFLFREKNEKLSSPKKADVDCYLKLKQANYSITDIGFQRGLYFMGPVSNLHGVIEVLSQFLKELFQEPTLLLYHKSAITQEVLNKAYVGRREITALNMARKLNQSVQAKTILLPFQQKEIENNIDYWLNNKIH